MASLLKPLGYQLAAMKNGKTIELYSLTVVVNSDLQLQNQFATAEGDSY